MTLGRYILIFVILTSFIGLQAQSDSLRDIYKNQENSLPVRLDAFYELINEQFYVNKDSALLNAKEFTKASFKLNDSVYIHKSYMLMAEYYTVIQNRDSLKINLESALSYANVPELKAECMRNLGNWYQVIGNEPKAIRIYQNALNIAEDAGSGSLRVKIKLANNLGNLFYAFDKEKARTYYQQEVKWAKEYGDEMLELYALGGLSYLEYEMGIKENAISSQANILNIAVRKEYNQLAANAARVLGYMYQQEGKIDSSIICLNVGIQKSRQIADHINHINALTINATNYLTLNDPAKSLTLCEEAYEISKTNEFVDGYQYCYECLAEAHKALGNYKEALKYQELLLDETKEYFSTDKTAALAENEVKYKFQRKIYADSLQAEQSLQLERQEKENQKTKTSVIIVASVILAGVLILFLIFAFNRNRIIKEQKALLNQEYLNLKEFTENASHEMQTPMAIINSKVESLMQNPSLSEDQISDIRMIYTSTYRMSTMNKSLLLISKIENKQYPINSELNISATLHEILDEFEEIIANKHLTKETYITPDVKKEANDFLASTIFYNLIKNAISHNIPQGSISITLTDQGLKIENSGKPLEENPELLFERFKKSSANENSTGLGLAIVKKSCEAHLWKVRYLYEKELHTLEVNFG